MTAIPNELAGMHCEACRPDSPPVDPSELAQFEQDFPRWQVVLSEQGFPQLERVFKFKDYRQALAFANQVAELAEMEDHHPALLLEWGKVTLTWWTHAIRGLHRNDLIMAAKTEQVYSDLPGMGAEPLK